jgi:pimeloyl-ACP methyl ester carboxylesterase
MLIMRKILLIIITVCFLQITQPANASVVLNDPFSGSYNNLWQVRPGSLSFTSSTHGIQATSSEQWSDIMLPIDEKTYYKVEFDLWINSDNVNSAWRVYISNNTFSEYKIVNNWGAANLLQASELSGLDELKPWSHDIGLHHFEVIFSPDSNTNIKVIEDGEEIFDSLTFSSFDPAYLTIGLLGNNDYELANFSLNTIQIEPTITPTLTPTLTLTNTPTPSNSPTPTITPFPTPTTSPAESQKVVVIPGYGGSWNRDALLNCKTTNYSGNWTEWQIEGADIYQPLIGGLTNAGFIPLPFYYDWRKEATAIGSSLDNFINHNLDSSENIDLVGHSFGGLVGRAYLEKTQTNSHLNKLLTVGSPHKGAAIVYPAWSGGVIWNNDIRFRLAATMLQVGCMLKHGWSARETIRNVFPSIQNLLPTFDYLENSQTHTLKPISLMQAKNNWLPTSFSPPFFGVTVGSITGIGVDTIQKIEVNSPSRNDIREGNWLDGKPTNTKHYNDGDGTVLAESSRLPGSKNITLPLNHGDLVSNPLGVSTIVNYLSNTNSLLSVSPSSSKEANRKIKPTHDAAALLIVVEDAQAILTDKNGNQIKDSDGQITVLSPHPEAYSLTIEDMPHRWRWPWWKPQYRVVVIQLFEDGTSTWKDYSHKGFFAKKWKIRFDRKNKKSDIFREK